MYDAGNPPTGGAITKYLVQGDTALEVTTAVNGALVTSGSLPSSLPLIDLSGLEFGGSGYSFLAGILLSGEGDFAGKTLNVANLNVEAKDTTKAWGVIGFAINSDFAGTLNFGNISVSSDSTRATVFLSGEGDIKNGAVLNFNGDITATTEDAYADGIAFEGIIESGATVNVNGNVHVTAGNGGGAAGVEFGRIAEGAVVNINGNITAISEEDDVHNARGSATGVYAYGAEYYDDDLGEWVFSKGTIVIRGNVYVEVGVGEYSAAIDAGNVNVILDTTHNADLSIYSKILWNDGTVEDGTSVDLYRGTLTIQGTHTFTNGGEAFVMQAYDSEINFDTNVKLTSGWISADGVIVNVAAGRTVDLGETDLDLGIEGYVGVNVGQGAALITTGETIIYGGTDYSIDGGGGVYLFGGVYADVADDDAEILVDGGSTLGVDISQSYVDDDGSGHSLTITLDGGSTFEVYGEASAMVGINEGDVIPGVFVDTEEGHFANRAIFSDFRHDATTGGITYHGLLGRANMSDAFLAAAMIHNRYTGYTMVRDHFISAARRSGNGYRGQAYCDPCEAVQCLPDPCDPCRLFGACRQHCPKCVGELCGTCRFVSRRLRLRRRLENQFQRRTSRYGSVPDEPQSVRRDLRLRRGLGDQQCGKQYRPG